MDGQEQPREAGGAQVYIDSSGNLRRTTPSNTAPSTWFEHVLAFLGGNGAMNAWKGVSPRWNEITYAEQKDNDV